MNPIGLILIAATTLFPAYQLFTLPNITDQTALFSQFLGLAALILMAWGQIMATRLPGLETLFGGLDRIYVLHKWAGIAAMVAILVHDTVDADMRGLGRGSGLNDLAETMGEISLYGLLILVVISIATFVPYHLWKWTHKAMGALFIAGAFHFVFITKPFAISDPAGLYTGIFCLAGILAYVWTLLPETMRPAQTYEITDLAKTGDATAITMRPKGRGLRPAPGQFGVLRFAGTDTAEPHPFSFSRIDEDGALRVTIKPLGDFTHTLERQLQTGQDVHIQGPFGRFRLAKTGPQVWIAGGIGITPFLAWARTLPQNADPVHLFYCAKSQGTAPHLEEIQTLAHANPSLNLHVIASAEGSRLTARMIADTLGTDIKKAKVAFCGPLGLRKALQDGLRHHGVSRRRFHYEEFEFRTGLGLKTLADWVLRNSQASLEKRQTSVSAHKES